MATGAKKIQIAAAGNAASEKYYFSFFIPNVAQNNQQNVLNIWGMDTDPDGNIYISGANDQSLTYSQGNHGAYPAGFTAKINYEDMELEWWNEHRFTGNNSDHYGHNFVTMYDTNIGDLVVGGLHAHRDQSSSEFNANQYRVLFRYDVSDGSVKSIHHKGTATNNWNGSSSTVSTNMCRHEGYSNNVTFMDTSDSKLITINPESSSDGKELLEYSWDNSNEAFTETAYRTAISPGGANSIYGQVYHILQMGNTAIPILRKFQSNISYYYFTSMSGTVLSTSVKEPSNFTSQTYGTLKVSAHYARKTFANANRFITPFEVTGNSGKVHVFVWSGPGTSFNRKYTLEDDDYPRVDAANICINDEGHKVWIGMQVRDSNGSNGRFRIYEMNEDGSLENCIELKMTTTNVWDGVSNNWWNGYHVIWQISKDALWMGNMQRLANDPGASAAGPLSYVALFKLPKDLSKIGTDLQTIEPEGHGSNTATITIQRVTANVTISNNSTSYGNIFTRSGGSSGNSSTVATIRNETTSNMTNTTYTATLGTGESEITTS